MILPAIKEQGQRNWFPPDGDKDQCSFLNAVLPNPQPSNIDSLHYSEVVPQFVDAVFICLVSRFFYFCKLVTLCSSLCLTKSPSLRCSFYTRSVTDLCQLTYIDRWLKRRHTEPLFPQLCILIRKSSNDSIILVLKTLCPKLLLTVIFIYLFFTLMPQIFLGMIHCCLVAKIFDSYEKHWDRCPVETHTLWDILRGTCSVYFAV